MARHKTDENASVHSEEYQQALIVARQRLWSIEPPEGQVWVLQHGQRVDGGWFFWQTSQKLRGDFRYPDDAAAGGPVGFTVRDNMTVEEHGLMSLPPGVDLTSK